MAERDSLPRQAAFLWSDLRVRWNPDSGNAAQHIEIETGDVTLGGILKLKGFDRETGQILGCDFIRDETLPVGTMVVEPKERASV